MVRWVFRCGKTCLGAVVGLAALIALAEVGLRITTISSPRPPVQNRAPLPTAVPSWVTGWELRPLQRTTIRSTEDEPFVFRTNRWGLRGGDVVVPKPANIFRIVCVGDANLVAADCPEPQTFCAELQSALQNGVNYPIEVVNAGLPLGGPSIALIQFERTIALMQPDAILVMIDAQDLVQDVALRKWVTRDRQGLPVSCAPLDDPMPKSPNMVMQLRDEFRLIDWGCQRLVQELSNDHSPPTSRTGTELPREQIARALTPLRELHQRCEARQARMLIVATPSRGTVVGDSANEPSAALGDASFFSVLGELLKQTGITGIDATSAFRKSAGGNEDGWNLDEQHDLAELVAQGLRERLPGPWSSPYFQQAPVTPASHRAPAAPLPR